ncbi:MAG TPA: hypothetical protein VF544_24985 [Pyrinomonadaceae bacterium]
MRCSSPRKIIILLCGMACLSALAACRSKELGPGGQDASPSATKISKCAEWARAQESREGLGWDMLYEGALRGNGFGPESPMWQWIHKDGPRPPVNKMVAEWKDEPIISSILIELIGPEGSPGGYWFIRTTNHLYRWSFNKGRFGERKEELGDAAGYDEAFERIACFEQAAPETSDTLFGGYYGFLSLYREGKSRQMLLTFRDLFSSGPTDSAESARDPNNHGRLLKALTPWLASSLLY